MDAGGWALIPWTWRADGGIDVRLMGCILDTKVPPGRLAVFWLGQNSFIFKTGNGTLVGLDLYLSRVRGVEAHVHAEPPVKAEDVVLDYVFSTHDHADHLDPYATPGILSRSPKAVFVSTPEGREHYVKLGVPASQALPMKPRETLALADFTVRAFYSVEPKEGFGTSHYGFLFAFPACTVYNMGDSSPGMAANPSGILNPVAQAKADMAMLPIIGDYRGRRPEQALAFAEIIRPKVVIPTHYDCFVDRTIDPQAFTSLFARMPDIKPVVIEYMGSYVYPET